MSHGNRYVDNRLEFSPNLVQISAAILFRETMILIVLKFLNFKTHTKLLDFVLL